MEQKNHKHHRRRRRWSTRQHLRLTLTSTSKLIGLNSMLSLLLLILSLLAVDAQLQQVYLLPGHNLENVRISEATQIGTIVHQLKAFDRTNENRRFSYHIGSNQNPNTFSVDELSGEIRLSEPLDRERQANITLVVSVFDNSDSSRNDSPLETKRKLIFIDDIDDSWPIFAPHKQSVIGQQQQQHQGRVEYQAETSELAPVGSIVLAELIASDADEGINAEMAFECRAKLSTNSACDVFSIEPRRLGSGRYSVTLRTKMALDFERVPSYRLTLIARGKRPSPLKGVPLESEALINIQIINVQDEGPVFVNAPYSLSIPEGMLSGTRLLELVVQDGDAAPQRELSVIVAPGPYKDYFQVSKDPELKRIWYLETSNVTLDREAPLMNELQGNMFTISLFAAELDELGQPVASELELDNALRDVAYPKATMRKENITIVLLDLPDSRPIFVQASSGRQLRSDELLSVNISESILTGASLPNLDLAIEDLDQGVNSRFRLTLVDSDIGPAASSVFALETELIYGRAEIVLKVLNSSLLDYEQPQFRSYRFSLIASKQSPQLSEPLVQMLELQVNIMDANDNYPQFERDQYVIEIPEGSAPGSLVAIIQAKDLDSQANNFGRIEYMLRGIGASKFKLVSHEGKILVNECAGGSASQCLDYEVQPSFSLIYEARDGGGLTRNVSVLINLLDVNDHAPKFTESIYKRELMSDNLSSKQNYISPQLIVRARDADGPNQGRNNITYRIRSSNLTGLEVEPNSGLVYLAQPFDLDNMIASLSGGLGGGSGKLMERRKVLFEAELIAEDNGNPPLNSSAKIQLSVKGQRDGAPQFKQDIYQAFVRENQPVGKPFFQVQAVDPDEKDSQLRYSLGFDQNDLLSINSVTGELSFKSKVDYDDFKDSPYNATVFATDNSRPQPLRATTALKILIQDVNDKAPKFHQIDYRATLIEGRSKPGNAVLQVQAIDPDKNHQLNYSLIIDQLTLSDRNGQQFSMEELKSSSTIGYLSKMSSLERSQLVANLRSLFHINKINGSIEIRSEPDYSFASSISIPVKVVDLNQEIFTQSGELQQDFANCTFFLQAHIDKSPIFAPPWSIEKPNYNLSMLEELPIGTQIFSLLAKDPTTNRKVELFEKVYESDPLDLFRVERSGSVLINKRIDFEELPGELKQSNSKRITLIVKAFSNSDNLDNSDNSPHFLLANLNIQVNDLNDNSPKFKSQNYSVSVSELATFPLELLSVQAEDRDSNEFGRVFYSLSGHSSDLFTIDPIKGSIGIKKGVKLDRDTEPAHSLLVTASDCNDHPTNQSKVSGSGETISKDETNQRALTSSACRRSSVFVKISLLDENDNDPVFVNVNRRGELEALTSETVSVGSIIGQAEASDADEGANSKLGYEIVRADESIASRLLQIDREGYIKVAEPLSGLGRSNPYRIIVRAFDHGKPTSRQSFATLLLTISDVVANDGVPKFIRPTANEVIELSEASGPSTFIYQVQAIDPDEDSNGKLMYKFIQPSDVFEIDPFTGVIRTQFRQNFYLDREQVPNYTLIVVAQDLGSPPKQAHQVLTIRLTDINDNEPIFERALDDPPVVLWIEEEAQIGSLIGTIQAIDRDIGQNALIGYEIIDGNQNNLFRLEFNNLVPATGNSSLGDSNYSPQNAAESDEMMAFVGNNACKIYSNARLDREQRDSYTLTIKASSVSPAKLRNSFANQLRDPLGNRNPFNQYNASDLSKVRVTIKLLDINDNKPVFSQQNAKSVVDSSAEIYSQLMVFKATDADSLDSDTIQYSILDVLYFSDSKFKLNDDLASSRSHIQPTGGYSYSSLTSQPIQPISARQVLDIDSRAGILRNAASLRPYIDGYFEVFVKAESGGNGAQKERPEPIGSGRRCQDGESAGRKSSIAGANQTQVLPYAEVENCSVAVTKAVVFVTHQRETFRFVFNKTKLNDRLDEFKRQIQGALEDIMFEQPQASSVDQRGNSIGLETSSSFGKAERIYLNTFNTDFYERDDGSLDFSTLTSCSQLVKFEDRQTEQERSPLSGSIQAPNQVIDYEEVLSLLRQLNNTQSRKGNSLFSQFGLTNIERCLPDRQSYRMSLSERLSLYFGIMIAFVGSILALIVSKMRKSYEKNLRLLQRSKYQFMSPCGTLAPGMQVRPVHHMSLGAIPGNNFIAPPYGSHVDFDGPVYDTWQL